MNFPYLHFLPGHFAGQSQQYWMVPLQFELGPLALVGPITVGLGPTALSSSPKNVEWPNVESIFFPLLWLRKKCRIRKMLHRHFFLFVIKEKMSSQKTSNFDQKMWICNLKMNLKFFLCFKQFWTWMWQLAIVWWISIAWEWNTPALFENKNKLNKF